jgi:diguanylate cyclase (GGDEF)-like protein/PAS domain S-box-containing protein
MIINESVLLSGKELSELCGEGYINVLLKKLRSLINADYTYVARIIEDTEAETIAFWGDNTFYPPIRYSLKGTPCEDLRCIGSACILSDITISYPTDKFLKDLSIQGYLGIALRDKNGKPIGILSALFKTPINPSEADSILNFFHSVAKRSSGELERIKYEHVLKHEIEELQEKNNKLKIAQQVYEFSQDGIIITDANNKIIFVNKALEQMSGYSTEELLGANPAILSCSNQNKLFYDTLWRQLLEQGHWLGEFENQTKKGQLYPASTSISVIPDDNGDIKNYVAIFRDTSEEKRVQKFINYQTTHDGLTDLYNRYEIDKRIHEQLDLLDQQEMCGAFLLLDIDDFKVINDIQGHYIGDVLLKKIADRLKSFITKDCIFGRLGGDEFAFFISFSDTQDVQSLIDSILSVFLLKFDLESFKFKCNVSIGVSIYPQDAKSSHDLFSRADQALHLAKKVNGSKYSYFTPQLQIAAERKHKVSLRLTDAIEKDAITVKYQPIVNLASGNIARVEALARWNDSKLGEVSPVEFIDIAEQTGQINKLGYQIANKALKGLFTINSTLSKPIGISINRSAGEFNEENEQLESLSQLAEQANIPRDLIAIEITESLLMEAPELARLQLDKLKENAFHLALDDFGTGFSSLAYLRSFPFDILKIDKSFVNDITVDHEAYLLVKTIIDMSKNLGLHSVAEGVETKEQLNILRELGCECIQGYYFSKPLDLESMISFIKTWNIHDYLE